MAQVNQNTSLQAEKIFPSSDSMSNNRTSFAESIPDSSLKSRLVGSLNDTSELLQNADNLLSFPSNAQKKAYKNDSLNKLGTITETKVSETATFLKNEGESDVFQMKGSKDSYNNKIDSLQNVRPATILKKQIALFKVKGTISAGYEYGLLPFAVGNQYPIGGFKSEGRVSFFLMKLPLELTYRYTSIKSVTGINNYFRLSYDAARYKEQLNENMSVKDQLNKKELNKLQLEKQNLAMRMTYLDLLNSSYSSENSFPDSAKRTGLGGEIPTMAIDTTQVSAPDSLRVLSYVPKKYQHNQKKDSIQSEKSRYKEQYDSVSNAINLLNKEIEDYKNINSVEKNSDNPYMSKLQHILANVKKFEIGLCNPTYSTFLVSNTPVQGINFEYATPANFFAVTYGTTVNSILYDPNSLQGALQGARNLYNFFDFSNPGIGRKILAIKGGTGQKENTHLFAGILFGKGRTDYLMPYEGSLGTSESNLVIEIDGRYKFSEVLSADLVYGKSSIQNENFSIEQVKNSFKEIFSPYRSNALMGKVNYEIKKTKTKLFFSGRIVDPYFKSFGVGFMRSDNLRYEVKTEQEFSKRAKYSISYRREEDNLLRLYNYKNTLQTISNTLFLKLSKGLTLRLNYSPLFRELKNGDAIIKDRNHISTAILSYMPRLKKVQANFNFLYSKYQITADTNNIYFDNIGYTHQFQFRNGFQTGLNLSWFKNSLKDTMNNDTYFGVLDIGYTSKKQNSFIVGCKMAYKPLFKPEYGFIARTTIKVYKTLFWEIEAEKILMGDYYNSLIEWKIRKFPYYFSTKLILNF